MIVKIRFGLSRSARPRCRVGQPRALRARLPTRIAKLPMHTLRRRLMRTGCEKNRSCKQRFQRPSSSLAGRMNKEITHTVMKADQSRERADTTCEGQFPVTVLRLAAERPSDEAKSSPARRPPSSVRRSHRCSQCRRPPAANGQRRASAASPSSVGVFFSSPAPAKGDSKRRVYGYRDRLGNVLIHVIFDYNVFTRDLMRV